MKQGSRNADSTAGSDQGKAKRQGKTYRNPYDQFDSWRGLGPRPAWLKRWLENGGTLEELRVGPDGGKCDGSTNL